MQHCSMQQWNVERFSLILMLLCTPCLTDADQTTIHHAWYTDGTCLVLAASRCPSSIYACVAHRKLLGAPTVQLFCRLCVCDNKQSFLSSVCISPRNALVIRVCRDRRDTCGVDRRPNCTTSEQFCFVKLFFCDWIFCAGSGFRVHFVHEAVSIMR